VDGRPSIPPERLLKAGLLMALYSVRSERAFCEELDYRLLFRWFLDMNLTEPSFDPTTFSKNRQRRLEHAAGAQRRVVIWSGDRARGHNERHRVGDALKTPTRRHRRAIPPQVT